MTHLLRLTLVVITSFLLLSSSQITFAQTTTPAEKLEVVFFDVGQGTSVLLDAPNSNILFDAGPDPQTVHDQLIQRGIDHLDLAIASHTHADHIAGFPEIFKDDAIVVDEIWYNGQPHSTLTFEQFLDAA